MAQTVKRLSAMWETWVWSLGQEDPLEKEMAIHSSTIAWKIPWTEEPGRLQSMRLQRVGYDWATSLHFMLFFMKRKLLSAAAAAKSLQPCPTMQPQRWTAAHQAPPSLGFSRQEYWSGLPLPSPIAFYSSTIRVIYAHYWRWFLSPESGVVYIFLLKNCVLRV